MSKIRLNYNNPLPDEYEKLMPAGLSPIERFEWRKLKAGELRIQGLLLVDDYGNCTFLDTNKEEQAAEVTVTESDNETLSEVVTNVDDLISEKVETKSNINLTRTKPSIKRKILKNNSRSESCEYEFVHNVPKSAMDALRRLFPCSASKADLISAAVYILTDGECNISDKAMELVNGYKSDDKLVSINERISHLEQATKRQLELLQSIELCTCFNTFDRRYGSNQSRKSPKQTEFREKDNLDMLERLREQAKDQLKIDELARGRQIYNQIKDKND